jgi:RNA polymerase sigma-19 factor, ECF subfamily
VFKQPNATDPTPSPDPPEVLIDKHAQRLYRFLLRRLFHTRSSIAPRDDAKDLLQTVFMRFCASPGRELVRKPEPYLFRIAENVLIEFRLRQDRDAVIYDTKQVKDLLKKQDEGTEEPAEWAEDPFEEAATDQQLKRVLAQIPPMYRAVLVLRTRDSLSLEEIAKELDITPGSAKVYLFRAIAACRAADWNR